MNGVLTWFELPSACKVDITITKTALKRQDGITSGESKLLEGTAVQSMRIVGVLSKERVNIDTVQTADRSYIEIDFIQVSLDEVTYAKVHTAIARLLHKLIPHHCIIMTQSNNGKCCHLSLATKHINKNDSQLRVLQDGITSDPITNEMPPALREALAFAKVDKTNLEAVYQYYVNVLHNYNLVGLTEEFKVRPYIQTAEMVLAREEIRHYESRIDQLKNKLKQAQMREMVELNTEIYDLKQQIQKLKNQLK